MSLYGSPACLRTCAITWSISASPRRLRLYVNGPASPTPVNTNPCLIRGMTCSCVASHVIDPMVPGINRQAIRIAPILRQPDSMPRRSPPQSRRDYRCTGWDDRHDKRSGLRRLNPRANSTLHRSAPLVCRLESIQTSYSSSAICRQLLVAQAEPPVVLIIGCAIRNPVWMFRK